MKKSTLLFVLVSFSNFLFCSTLLAANRNSGDSLNYHSKTLVVSPPTVSSPIYYCQNSTAEPLTATPSSPLNTLLWYTVASGGTGNPVAPTPSTAVVGSTTYYVSETDGTIESARSSIVVNVVADNGTSILSFRCDPTQIAAADKNSSVYFDWTNTAGIPNQYSYVYSIQGGPDQVSGNTGLSHLQVFGMSPGQSATLTLWHTTYPCDRSVLTCSVPCGASTVTPTFNQIPLVCEGSAAPSLPSSSNEGITGTWTPATIDSNTTGTVVHTFTPDPVAYPCATSQTMSVTVEPRATPVFNSIPSTVCQNDVPPVLPLTSDNATPVSGTWTPATVNTAVLGPLMYTFNPDPGQCVVVTPTTVTITVIPSNVNPGFAPIPPICFGEVPPTLNTTSPNNITGTWSPSVVDNTADGSYTFTPDPNQCANPQTLNVTVTPKTVPDFASIAPFCAGSAAPVLNMTSPNGVSGTWSPDMVDNMASGSYVFTPDANECATTQTLDVIINDPINPGFSSFLICSGSVPPSLDTTSPNGITGTWSPSVVDNMTSGSYLFAPDSGQCASSQVIDITVAPSDMLVDFQWEVTEAFAKNQIVTITAISVGGDYLYQLDDGPFQESAVFENVASGTHSVTVIDANGCSNPITKTDIHVVGYPKYFTPNNDGYNDVWNIFELNDQSISLIYIFDRYGKLLKEISPSGDGWNGTFNGRPMPADDYWFVIHYNEDNVDKEFRSHFSLKR